MKTTKKRKKIDFSAYLFILPVSLFFITFVLVPMLRGLQLSLYSFAKKNPVFVGLKHYSDLLFSGSGATIHEPFMKSLINTIIVTVVAVPIVVLVSCCSNDIQQECSSKIILTWSILYSSDIFCSFCYCSLGLDLSPRIWNFKLCI